MEWRRGRNEWFYLETLEGISTVSKATIGRGRGKNAEVRVLGWTYSLPWDSAEHYHAHLDQFSGAAQRVYPRAREAMAAAQAVILKRRRDREKAAKITIKPALESAPLRERRRTIDVDEE